MRYTNKFTNIYASFAILTLFSASCINVSTVKTFDKFAQIAPYDAIIVPGLPFEDDQWSELMKQRVHWAVSLYKKGLTRNIIFSGAAVYTPYCEAEIMRLYAIELGVKPQNILIEDRAEHSSENLYYSYLIGKQNGCNKIALATDPFQNSFLRRFAQKIYLTEVGFLPIVYSQLRQMDLKTPIIDYASLRVENFESLPERESFAVRFKGTMGKYIDYAPGDSPEEKKKELLVNR